MKKLHKVLSCLVAVAALVVGGTSSAGEPTRTEALESFDSEVGVDELESQELAPAYSCKIDGYQAVKISSGMLRIHVSPSTSSTVVGELANKVLFHDCSSSERTIGGTTWIYGYGMNGSTKVTGWAVENYLESP